MKQFATILLCITFIFSSCGGDQDTTKKVLETSEYSMNIPASWYIIDDTTLKTSLPEGSYRAARATLALQGTYSKITLTKETLLLPTSSLKYAEANIVKAPTVTTQYTLLRNDDIEIGKEKTKLHIFEAKLSNDAPVLLYIQAYVVHNEHNAYTISFSTVPTEKNYDKYISYMKTFQWK